MLPLDVAKWANLAQEQTSNDKAHNGESNLTSKIDAIGVYLKM